MERRVVITGLGAITPIGNNVEEFWNGIKERKCGNSSDFTQGGGSAGAFCGQTASYCRFQGAGGLALAILRRGGTEI